METNPVVENLPVAKRSAAGKLLDAFLQNPHVYASLAVYATCDICAIWIPSLQPKFAATKEVAVFYFSGASVSALRKKQ